MKLLIRGGSIAAGVGVQKTYIDILREDPRLASFEIINRSAARNTSFEAIWNFDEEIDPVRPDILLLHLGVDDAYRPVYRSEFKENLVQIVRRARNRFDPQIILLTSHPFENPYDMEMVYIYYRTIREVSQDLSCEMVPIHVWWWGYLEEHGERIADYVQQDTRLPNEKGHALYAIPVMEKLLQTSRREK